MKLFFPKSSHQHGPLTCLKIYKKNPPSPMLRPAAWEWDCLINEEALDQFKELRQGTFCHPATEPQLWRANYEDDSWDVTAIFKQTVKGQWLWYITHVLCNFSSLSKTLSTWLLLTCWRHSWCHEAGPSQTGPSILTKVRAAVGLRVDARVAWHSRHSVWCHW